MGPDELHEKIKKGEYKVSELETLRLQKLYHQKLAMDHQINGMIKDLEVVQQRRNDALLKMREQLETIQADHGLEPWHDVVLNDDRAGAVVVNRERKAKLDGEAKKAEEAE